MLNHLDIFSLFLKHLFLPNGSTSFRKEWEEPLKSFTSNGSCQMNHERRGEIWREREGEEKFGEGERNLEREGEEKFGERGRGEIWRERERRIYDWETLFVQKTFTLYFMIGKK